MIGPGKYDLECESAMIATNARAVMLVIAGGRHGDGFSVCLKPEALGLMVGMPRALRSLADQIEIDVKKLAETSTKQ